MTDTPETKASESRVVLASASVVRAALLSGAGLAVTVDPASIDENELKCSLAAEGASAEDAAVALAHMKALRISPRHSGAFVIGADQILEVDGRWFDKPADMDQARENLRELRGRTHGLATAACIVRDGERIWHQVETPKLAMRDFSDEFLEYYLREAGDGILSSVGAYRLEGLGVQLFQHIDGSYFTILGLPLLALLDFLRANGVVAA
ncbi:MAG: Maf family protein [Alphaproteobacteria bacterium]|nr:Maf family protein [Alphaproteobacteria bacterium]